ncbi:putative transporter svop-1 isoform X2 [Pectinophora gossypiella]|nr:putative transporter svop-1 isoform X2 [Pectinophora gossypiella]
MLMMVMTGSVTMAMAFETSSVAYLVPASACELLTTSQQQGLMAGMPLIGILAMSNVWGYLADTRGRRKILLLALILGFITSSSATLAPNWIVFCVLKFLSSSAMAGTYGLGNAFLSECTPSNKRSTLIVLVTTIFASSVGVMAALTIPILPLTFSFYMPVLGISFNSWRLLNIIFSLPCAIGAVGAFLSLESPKYLLSVGREQEALEVMRKMFVINTGEDADRYKVTGVVLDEVTSSSTSGFWRSVVSQTIPLLKPPLIKSTMLLSAIFVTVYICVNPFTVWLPYMVDGFMRSLEKGERGLTFCEMLRSSQNDTVEVTQPNDCSMNHTAMLMVLGLYLLQAILNVLMSMMLPICGRKTMLISIQVVGGICALVVNFSTIWALTAVLIIAFITGMLNFGLLSTFSVDMFPTYVKAMGVCLTLMVGRGSAVLGINLLKSLLSYNCEYSFYVFGSISLVGALMALLLPSDRTTEKKDVETPK